MKYALCNELFEAWNHQSGFDFPKTFEFIKRCGYDGVEIAPFTIELDAFAILSKKRVEIRHQAKQSGLEITGLHWLLAKTNGYYLTSPDTSVRQKTADYFRELIRLCAELGGNVMVLGSPKQRNCLSGVTKYDAMNYAAEVLAMVVPTLKAHRVHVALEPLAPNETDFLTTAQEAVELIQIVGESDWITLHLDCKAMSAETQPIPELIRGNRKYLTYFHANDPNLQGPGFGKLDFVPIMQALKDIGYCDWVSVEVFDYLPGIERLAIDSIKYLKACENQ